LVLEDLHLADLPTVRFLDAALRRVRELPVFVLATARPEVHTRFPGLWSGHPLVHVHLAELPRKTSERFVREALDGRIVPAQDSSGVDVARQATDATSDPFANVEADAGQIAERAEGNPLLLEELVRAAVDQRALPAEAGESGEGTRRDVD